MTPSNLETYIKVIAALAKSKSDIIFPNSSPEHAAVVISAIIKNSNNIVRIYDDRLNGDIADKNHLVGEAITDFIENSQKTLKVVLREDQSYDTNIFRLLSKCAIEHPERVEIRKASVNFRNEVKNVYQKDINFSVGDNSSFRMEKVDNNHEHQQKREAICSFNQKEVAGKLINVFDKYLDTCPKISFS